MMRMTKLKMMSRRKSRYSFSIEETVIVVPLDSYFCLFSIFNVPRVSLLLCHFFLSSSLLSFCSFAFLFFFLTAARSFFSFLSLSLSLSSACRVHSFFFSLFSLSLFRLLFFSSQAAGPFSLAAPCSLFSCSDALSFASLSAQGLPRSGGSKRHAFRPIARHRL